MSDEAKKPTAGQEIVEKLVKFLDARRRAEADANPAALYELRAAVALADAIDEGLAGRAGK